MMTGLAKCESTISTANARLTARNGKRVAGADEKFWSDPSRAETLVQHPPWSIANQLRLPSAAEARTFIWPERFYEPLVPRPQPPEPAREPQDLGPVTAQVCPE
jgi:hypothetical protein